MNEEEFRKRHLPAQVNSTLVPVPVATVRQMVQEIEEFLTKEANGRG